MLMLTNVFRNSFFRACISSEKNGGYALSLKQVSLYRFRNRRIISLTSFSIKVVEELIDQSFRNNVEWFSQTTRQFAYRNGKTTKHLLHSLDKLLELRSNFYGDFCVTTQQAIEMPTRWKGINTAVLIITNCSFVVDGALELLTSHEI